jgi:acetyl-CoA C-acetyltransferase
VSPARRPGLDAFIFDAVRTPRGAGRQGGALAAIKPIALLQPLYRALAERHDFAASAVDDVVLGCSAQTGEQGANLAKISSLYAGWPESISGVTLSRFCASGLDAVAYAALKVHSGMERLVVAGGVESLSRVPMFADGGAWFADGEVAAATRFLHMGVAADVMATLEGITRADCDAWAAASQARAGRARDERRFGRSLVVVRAADGSVVLDRDECIRDGVSPEKLALLPPAFAALGAAALATVRARHPRLTVIDAVHHVGSSPALADGAGLLLMGNAEAAARWGLLPRARVRAFANVSVDPVAMLTGPSVATEKALRAAGLTVGDVDLFECNESFAATPIAFMRRLGIDGERVNVNGGAIALGHPLGATGAMLVATLVDELERRGLALGVATIPAGAGIAEAVVIERT